MAGADTLASRKSHRKARPERAKPWEPLRQLSDRTPLRTKLIMAVLVLVIAALAAISIATTYMLGSYVTTRQDSDLQATFSQYSGGAPLPH